MTRELLVLALNEIKPLEPDLLQIAHAGFGAVKKLAGEFERKQRHRPGQTLEDRDFKTFDIDLAIGGRAVVADDLVERGHGHLHDFVPFVIGEAAGFPFVRKCGDGVGLAANGKFQRACFFGQTLGEEGDAPVFLEALLQSLHAFGLRFDTDHPRALLQKQVSFGAHVRAHVKDGVAGADEPPPIQVSVFHRHQCMLMTRFAAVTLDCLHGGATQIHLGCGQKFEGPVLLVPGIAHHRIRIG